MRANLKHATIFGALRKAWALNRADFAKLGELRYEGSLVKAFK